MRLYAISDVHVGYGENRALLESIGDRHREDWVILAGDVGETTPQLSWTFELLAERFARVIWTPGNHDLWTLPHRDEPYGVARYLELVTLARSHGIVTPEDPYPAWEGEGGRCTLVPLFLLYDYSFRPSHVPLDGAVRWAMESDVLCADELYLRPDPFASVLEWCEARLVESEARLATLTGPCVLINHFPLRRDLVRLRRYPRFEIWCGTRRTEDWHLRYRARAVVSGHLHVPSTLYRDRVRFEEVSLGYPSERGPDHKSPLLREILPGPRRAASERSLSSPPPETPQKRK